MQQQHDHQDRGAVASALGYLRDEQVADFLNVSIPTLKNRRAKGDAPLSSKIGREHVTTVEDLKRWVASRKAARAAA